MLAIIGTPVIKSGICPPALGMIPQGPDDQPPFPDGDEQPDYPDGDEQPDYDPEKRKPPKKNQ